MKNKKKDNKITISDIQKLIKIIDAFKKGSLVVQKLEYEPDLKKIILHMHIYSDCDFFS